MPGKMPSAFVLLSALGTQRFILILIAMTSFPPVHCVRFGVVMVTDVFCTCALDGLQVEALHAGLLAGRAGVHQQSDRQGDQAPDQGHHAAGQG